MTEVTTESTVCVTYIATRGRSECRYAARWAMAFGKFAAPRHRAESRASCFVCIKAGWSCSMPSSKIRKRRRLRPRLGLEVKEGARMRKKKGRIGLSFDDLLKDEGIYEEVTARAIKARAFPAA